MTTTKTTKKTEWQVEKLPPNPFMSEILELVHKQRSKAKKIEVLKHYRDDALTALLIWNFDPSVVSALPDGDVPESFKVLLRELMGLGLEIHLD